MFLSKFKSRYIGKYIDLMSSVISSANTKNKSLLEWQFSQKYLLDKTLHNEESGVCDTQYVRDSAIVVSLTTYGKRLYESYLPIESIMQQTMKPNRIILWLAEELHNTTLPITLQRQIKRGLEVRYYKDIRSYKKLIPTLKICPHDAVITIDDDVIYRFDMIENLVNSYIQEPYYVYCNRMHRMKIDKNRNNILPYKSWSWDVKDEEVSLYNFPTGCGGVLYPPQSLSEEVLNEKVFMNLCPFADDVWFKAMALLNNYQDRKVRTSEDTYLLSDSNQDMALFNKNVLKNANDSQIKAVFDRYQLYDMLMK